MIAPFLEVSSCDYSNHLDINFARKSLIASCVFVWLKFKCALSTRSSPAPKCSSSAYNSFVSSNKSVHPQHKTCSSLAINLFACRLIRIWRRVAETILSLAMDVFDFSVKSHLEVGSRDYLVASDKHIRLLFRSFFYIHIFSKKQTLCNCMDIQIHSI